MSSTFNKDYVNLQSIIESINKITDYSDPFVDADDFHNHQMEFDAVMMNFIIIGEMVARLSDEFVTANSNIDWLNIRGFRNIIAHDYFGIDAEEVWQIIQTDIKNLLSELKKILDQV